MHLGQPCSERTSLAAFQDQCQRVQGAGLPRIGNLLMLAFWPAKKWMVKFNMLCCNYTQVLDAPTSAREITLAAS